MISWRLSARVLQISKACIRNVQPVRFSALYFYWATHTYSAIHAITRHLCFCSSHVGAVSKWLNLSSTN